LSKDRKRVIWASPIIVLAIFILTLTPSNLAVATPKLIEQQIDELTVEVLGSSEIVLDYSEDKCDVLDIPDLAARAFIDSDGKTQLISTHYTNRRMIGNDLDAVSKDCHVIMESDESGNPSTYDDFEWLGATYTEDGSTIYAIIHNEYHGWEHNNCNVEPNLKCWWNALTSAISQDKGMSYTHQETPNHLVMPYIIPYNPNSQNWGYYAPSNIIKKNGYYYVLYQAEGGGDINPQQWGVCIMRTNNLANPTSWRFWDGNEFNGIAFNPYEHPGESPNGHECAVISRENIQKMHESVTFNTFINKYVLVGLYQEWLESERRYS